jgi:hypothetical protein
VYRFEAIAGEVPVELRDSLSRHLSHQLMGETALAWVELMRAGVPGQELHLYRITQGHRLIGIAIVSVVRGLDTRPYLWRPIGRVVNRLFRRDVGFLELPLLNLPGLLTVEGIDSRKRGEILDGLRRELAETLALDALLIKVDGSIRVGDAASDRGGLIPISFYPNALLPFPYAAAESFFLAQKRKKWRKYRNERRALEEYGGIIEQHEELSPILPRVVELYGKTAREVKKRPHHISMPVTIGEPFFAALERFPELSPRILTVRVKDRIIAYALLLQSGDTLLLKAIGLDYQLSYPTKAYFNLVYGALDLAGQQGCTRIDLGMTSYTFKRWLGCEILPAAYLGDVYNPYLRKVGANLIGMFERKVGLADAPSPFS